MAIFDGSEGAYITLSMAQSMGSNYTSSDRYEKTAYLKAHFLGKDKLSALLNQSGCMGLRIYYGTKIVSSVEVPDFVIVAADEDGNDILDNNLILDSSIPCPPTCPESGKGVMG